MSFYDIAYALGVGVAAPYWLLKPKARRKVLRAFRERMGHVEPRGNRALTIMIHAVSLGEMNATRALVNMLQGARPNLHFIISTTTDTGFDRAKQLYGTYEFVTLIRFPLDFTGAVGRMLDALRPDIVALMELEVWPNFLIACERRDIPVVVINGRMTEYSFTRYRRIRFVTRRMFGRVAAVCAQDETYARRFIELGAPPERVLVTGTMKFDTAEIATRVEGDELLGSSVRLNRREELIWVAGSTGPGEEQIILRVYRALLGRFSSLRLVIVPRHPERFDEVATLIGEMKFRVIRRSNPRLSHEEFSLPPVVLGDTMGELRKFYSLARIIFVGRSLVDLGSRQHGSDMIEPAALGKAIVVGPYTGNFAEAVMKFRVADAIFEVKDEAGLKEAVSVLLSSPFEAADMARRAQQVVKKEQGATARHAKVILDHLHRAR